MSIETRRQNVQTKNELVNEVNQESSETFFPIPGPLSKDTDRYLLGPQTRIEISENGDYTLLPIEEIIDTTPEVIGDSSRQGDKPRNEMSLDLTPRLFEAAVLQANGMSAKDIAQQLNISVKTARNYCCEVLDRCNVHNHIQLSFLFYELGLLDRKKIENITEFSSSSDITLNTIVSFIQNNYVPALTEKQIEAIQLKADGLSLNQIADKLHIKPTTVKSRLREVNSKLQTNDTTLAIIKALKLGFIKI